LLISQALLERQCGVLRQGELLWVQSLLRQFWVI